MISSRIYRWATISVLCLTVLITLPHSQQATAQEGAKPMAVVSISGYDDIISDVNFVGSLVGMPGMGDQYKPFIEGYVRGLDKTKPIGVVVQADGPAFSGAACIPVSDFQNIMSTIKLFGIPTEDLGDGVTKVIAPQQAVFVKEQAGWAYVAPNQQMLAQIPANPEKLFTELNQQYDIGAKFFVQNIPEMYRQMGIDALQGGMQGSMRKLPDESEEAYEARQESVQLQIDQIVDAINETEDIIIGLSLDGEQQRAYLDFVMTAVSGSDLAKDIANSGAVKTDFAGFGDPDAAVSMTMATKLTDADISNFDQMVGSLRKQAKAAVEKEAQLPTEDAKEVLKSAVDDFIDALAATVKSGKIDGGLIYTGSTGSLNVVAGAAVGDSDKILSGLKKIEGAVKQGEEFPGIQWDAQSHAGISFHTLSVPTPADPEELSKMFGDTMDLAVGIGDNAVYVALGPQCIETASAVIDASSADPQKEVPPMELTMSFKKIIELAAGYASADEKPMLDMLAGILASEAQGRDHVRMVASTIDNGMRFRLEAEEGVLRAIGAAAMQAQMQAAGAGAGF